MSSKPTGPAGKYELEQVGDAYVFSWDGGAVQIEVERIVEGRSDVSAEIKVICNVPPHQGALEWGRINLSAMQTRASLARNLSERLPFDWQGALLQVAHRAVQLRRQGEPSVSLWDVEPRGPLKWVLFPYLERGGPALFFADGGTGKSVLALMMAYSIASGEPLLGTPKVDPCPVLYLDWETDAQTHAERLRAIHSSNFFGCDYPPIRYRRMVGSLADGAIYVKKEIDEHGIGVIVVDSISLAAGGPLEESATATAFFDAIRYLNVPPLCITHVSKAVNSNVNRADPFGSIFWRNTARLAWFIEAERDEGDDTTILRFENVKTNNGRYFKQHGKRVHFENRGDPGNEELVGITIEDWDLNQTETFAKKLSWNDRIASVLRHGPMSYQEVTEELGLGEDQQSNVRSYLSKARKKGIVVNLPDSRWALAHRG